MSTALEQPPIQEPGARATPRSACPGHYRARVKFANRLDRPDPMRPRQGEPIMIASDVMSRPVVSVSPSMPVRSAMVLLVENAFGALPVVGEGERLLGVVSEGDLLRSRTKGSDVGVTVAD